MRTLTVLPVPGQEAARLGDALPWFPAVGLALGFLLWAVAWAAAALGIWPEGAALLVIAGGALLTRGLHLDGLGDWADGFWGGQTREKTLAIMKDPRMGAFGVVALIVVLLAKWACVARLITDGAASWIAAACVISRAMQVDLAASQPYARAEGGTAAPFVEGARPAHAWIALLASLAILACLGRERALYAAALAFAWAQTRLFGQWCRRRTGGVTGDLLGAGGELAETTVLFLGAALRRG